MYSMIMESIFILQLLMIIQKIFLDYMYNTNKIEIEPKDNNTDQSVRYLRLKEAIKYAKN